MLPYSRKEFIRTSAIALAGLICAPSLAAPSKDRRLAFSTLGCPDWDLNRIMDFASQYGYSGIEVRGIQRELDLTKCKEFSTPAARKETMKRMRAKGLQFVNLGSSANLHTAAPAERTKQLDEAKRFIDLANELNCPYVRVFPNNFPKDSTKEATIALIADGLKELGKYAGDSGVRVLMETHGDLVRKDDLISIMNQTDTKNTGLIWDISNMWTVTGEDITNVYDALKPYLYHVHLKDAKKNEGKLDYVFLGKGDVPIMSAIELLAKNNYKGYYSFEWEKLWHPEIADPAEAFADFSNTMNKFFNQ